MWTERERDELLVWADQLQARGEPLGELITTSVALEARGWSSAEPLRQRLERLDAEVHAPIVEQVFAGAPELEPTWEHGMVVALRVVDPLDRRLGPEALDSLRRLLRLPVARFLRYLRVDARAWLPVLREVAGLLVEPEVVARPWVVVLGAPPRHMRRRSPANVLAGALGADLDELIDLERGLRSLFLDGGRIELPWHPGDKRARRLAAIEGRATLDRDPISLTRIARSLWDPSLRVRMATLDVLPLLGVDAAPLVPELLLVERGPLEWITRVREVLDTLGRNPQVVEAVARNFTADQTRCAGWLAANPMAVARHSAPRIASMLHASGPIEGWAQRELEQARRGMSYRARAQLDAQQLDSRSPTSQPLLRRLRRPLMP